MKPIRIESIKPEMLSWAINRAGLNVHDFLASYPDFRLWMSGEKFPTRKQLEAFANRVHVPFGFLFLDTPPVESMPIPMFRGSSNRTSMNLDVYDTVLMIQRRQAWVEEYLEELEADELDFVGSLKMRDGVDEACKRIAALLNLPKGWSFRESTVGAAVNRLVTQMEELRVFSAVTGFVGNNTRRTISVVECRGFALVSKLAPFVFVNNSDSKYAQVFTLIHEFTHLLLGKSSGYGGLDGANADAEERFCDRVAACFLVPEDLLRKEWTSSGADEEVCRKRFKVSRLVIMRRALELGLISKDRFNEFYRNYANGWLIPEQKNQGGADYYKGAAKRVGRLFGAYVDSAVKSGQLMYTDAYRLTGLTGATYENFMKKL